MALRLRSWQIVEPQFCPPALLSHPLGALESVAPARQTWFGDFEPDKCLALHQLFNLLTTRQKAEERIPIPRILLKETGCLQKPYKLGEMEKAEAIVIRQADFSESSRVVTLFSKEFGKFGCLAKGAKRLKGPFDAALDLLSTCRIVFIRKSEGALSLLTQASLVQRFSPVSTQLSSLYGGYYVAELLNGLTEDFDPDARIFEAARTALEELSDSAGDASAAIVQFEITLLRLTGHFPDLTECSVCGEPVAVSGRFTHWVGQGGLLCSSCRRPEFADKSISAGSIAVLQQITKEESTLAGRVKMTRQQAAECHQVAVSAITNVLGRKPGTLRYLKF